MIDCVVFDFDGTLVLSNDIKRNGFLVVAARFSGGPERMEAILADPPGDRFAIFDLFAADVGGNPAELVGDYSLWCDDGIRDCPLRPGTSVMLAQLGDAGIPMHVNSATPTEPLRRAVLGRFGPDVFAGIHGGHGAKVRNLQTIMASERLGPGGILMVGDGVDDRAAAREVGCRFVGLDGGTLAAGDDEHLLHRLDDLKTCFERPPA